MDGVSLSRLARLVSGLIAAGACVLVLPALAYVYVPAFGPPSGNALNHSIAREVGGSVPTLGDERCLRDGEAAWNCGVYDSQASGTVWYRVAVIEGCWRAQKRKGQGFEEGPPLKRRASGCVKARDQLRLVQRLVG